ncbi:glycosyltransferase family 2 protein [Devosia sp.]|uniref:glycosyltransferase family 2 protein n=1 Tax=Devosia sp. TaxID=1871048 RepID=UPI0019E8E2B1|nr:glycosyltransferase family 2 protein [Devosia sp.]MBE0579202.1 glycosyltransferase [Devosia sp.]
MQSSDRRTRGGPLISVIMANFQAGGRIVPAIRSVLGQTMGDVEIIVSDDASRDNSLALVRAMMADDPRIRVATEEANRGPAHCRNRALDLARGDWVAIVDSDDIIHPERFERLLAVAARHDADIVADDLLLFHEDGSPPKLMLGAEAQASFIVSPMQWVLAGLDGSPALGYLKPMIRAERLRGVRYDEALRIGEDYDFVLRLLLDNARMVVAPEPLYLYRRHSASISHRLSVGDMKAMVERQRAFVATRQPLSTELAAALATRLAALQQGLAYEDLVSSIKERKLGQALRLLRRNPGHFGRLWRSFMEGRQHRERDDKAAPRPSEPLVLGGQGSSGASRIVPDYVPTALVDWSAPRPRGTWRELASYAGTRCVALDQAGRYAAGFIPEVMLADASAVPEAS